MQLTPLLLPLAGLPAGWSLRLLLGRLRRGVAIPPGWCEVAVPLLWSISTALSYTGALPRAGLPLCLVVGWLLVAFSCTDLLAGRLPNALTLPAVPLVAAVLWTAGSATLTRALLAGAALFTTYAVAHAMSRSGLGAGDVKLAPSAGMALGAMSWPAVALGAFGGLALTALFGLWWRRTGRAIPHGPPLLAAVWLVADCPRLVTVLT
ncbi:prepilin peptidase [Pseudonocardiaceae bacterium YIM PH 21723]|nr:prepilin peptidase [Pseudonocardiaceae bacterium YIM PH 21723]